MKRLLFHRHFDLICKGYLLIANNLLIAMIQKQPLVISWNDDDYYRSGLTMWLIDNVPFTYDNDTFTFKIHAA